MENDELHLTFESISEKCVFSFNVKTTKTLVLLLEMKRSILINKCFKLKEAPLMML
jgi:hypothetical protein